VLYLGNTYTSDGYPLIDLRQHGSFAGIIETVEKFVRFSEDTRVVPGRGPIGGIRDVRAYRDMLVTIRDRVQALIAAGRTLEQTVAAKPTADLDATWGHGPVTPDLITELAYKSLTRPTKK